jgi:hypothetical protein
MVLWVGAREPLRKGGEDAAWRVQRLIHRVRKKTHFPVARRRGEILYRGVSRALGVAEAPARADHVVVSLTSFPLRIGKLHQVVSSLLDQSMQPSRIVLYLPLSEFPCRSVPRSLSRLEGEQFEIRFVSDNLRPYNKLLPAIADFPGTWIAVTWNSAFMVTTGRAASKACSTTLVAWIASPVHSTITSDRSTSSWKEFVSFSL